MSSSQPNFQKHLNSKKPDGKKPAAALPPKSTDNANRIKKPTGTVPKNKGFVLRLSGSNTVLSSHEKGTESSTEQRVIRGDTSSKTRGTQTSTRDDKLLEQLKNLNLR